MSFSPPGLVFVVLAIAWVGLGPHTLAQDFNYGQALLNAVGSVRDGEDSIIRCHAVTNMTGCKLNITSTVTKGSFLVIPRDDSGGRALLDMDGGVWATAEMGGTSVVHMVNITFVRSCCMNTTRGVTGLTWFGNTNAAFLRVKVNAQIPTYQRMSHSGLHVYTTQQEISAFVYWHVMQETQFTVLQPWRAKWLVAVANTRAVIRSVTPRSIVFHSASFPAARAEDNHLIAADGQYNPDSLVPPGTPMPPLGLCNMSFFPAGGMGAARLLRPDEFETNTLIFPYWPTDSTPALFAALLGQRWSATQRAEDVQAWPSVIMVLGDATLSVAASGTAAVRTAMNNSPTAAALDASALSPPFLLPGYTLFHGPFNHLADYSYKVTLDLGSASEPIVRLGVTSQWNDTLMFSKLTLAGLAKLPLSSLLPATGALARNSTAADFETTALPLWALSRQLPWWQQDALALAAPQVQLYNVTLVLPQSDYAALLAAALRGPSWRSGAVATAPLFRGLPGTAVTAGISTFEVLIDPDANGPAAPLNASAPSFTLLKYVGWGVNGSYVRVVPDVPVPTCTQLPDWAGLAPGCSQSAPNPTDGSRSNRAVALGVGLGVGLGAGLLALLIGLLIVVKGAARRRRQSPGLSDLDTRTSKEPGTNSACTLAAVLIGASTTHKAEGHEAMTHSLMLSQGILRLCDEREEARGTPQQAVSKGGSHLSSNGSSSPQDEIARSVAIAASTLNADQEAANKLTLSCVVGQGSWGTVYRGAWKGLDVAVKTLVFTSNDQRAPGGHVLSYERAVNEAAVCTSVLHRNVVCTYRYDIKLMQSRNEAGHYLEVSVDDAHASGVHEYKLYLIQEFCNTSLGAAMHANMLHHPGGGGPILELVMLLMLDVAQGVGYLHSKGIIHGDLKPDNVMIKPDRGCALGIVAKLTDFGLATAIDPTATHVSNYKSGTPLYVAPEVVNVSRVTRASDIYSFGVMLWEMYVDTPLSVKRRDGSYGRNPLFPQLPSTAPADYASLVSCCLAKAASERPTAAQASGELVVMLMDRGLSVPPSVFQSLAGSSHRAQPSSSSSPAPAAAEGPASTLTLVTL